MKKKLVLVAAPSACGKTYVSEQIAKSIQHIVYLDKDDLCDLVRAAFAVAGQNLDMDGDFYGKSLRPAEYSTILNIAFSALRFSSQVLLNAPFVKEVRDIAYMQALKDRANQMGAELLLIWVTAPLSVCFERMKSRNSDRDILKLENWDDYVSKVNFTPPFELIDQKAVDSLLVFDTKDDSAFQHSLDRAIEILTGE